jgi:hypothetical protein
MHRVPEFFKVLIDLTKSDSERMRLNAVQERGNSSEKVNREANGRLLPGVSLNPAGRPAHGPTGLVELRKQYMHRVPEFFKVLIDLTKSDSERMRLNAVQEILDRLIGKPQQTIEATTTRVDVGALYLQALQRANGDAAKVVEVEAEMAPATSHIIPSAD